MLGLSLNESPTLAIAAYAAIVSTFVLGCDTYKWLNQGPRLNLTAQTDMKPVGTGQVSRRIRV